MTENQTSEALNAVVRRHIRKGAEEQFSEAMRRFMREVEQQPGHLGINVFQSTSDPLEFTVIDRFESREARTRFTSSPEYERWMDRLRQFSEADPAIEEVNGLSFWFSKSSSAAARRPSTLKMSFVTLLGVYPLTMIYPRIVIPLAGSLPGWLTGLIISALVVATLSWVVMPLLTRVLHDWLFGPSKEGPR